MCSRKVCGGPLVLVMGLGAFALDALAVEEILVTTRKREENLQTLPIAVDAITAADIERKGLVSLKELVQESSSVILDQGFAPKISALPSGVFPHQRPPECGGASGWCGCLQRSRRRDLRRVVAH